ncbi:hypothetical protein [Holospora curviuscula]|uniref:Uncharacterized protein n=1 Tax=Holospora curviuscula TaxID=1082868 RepID=A0A2S5R799_9PROT|nr:hypothetical protein [Holospora curviuscula]PPE03173.1 hypothetical protein HCUR_01373 [Holospora curviuscula]
MGMVSKNSESGECIRYEKESTIKPKINHGQKFLCYLMQAITSVYRNLKKLGFAQSGGL